jgi:competence protein ComEC
LTLIYISGAWLGGIWLGASFTPPWMLLFTGLAPLSLLSRFREHRQAIILASLSLFAFFGGALRFGASLPALGEGHVASANEQGVVSIKGLISAPPEMRDKTTHLRLSAVSLNTGDGWQEMSGVVLLIVPRYPSYDYGDSLLVTGKLETPAEFDGFDYRGYLAQQGIYSTMLYPKIGLAGKGQGSRPLALIYTLRDRISSNLATALPEPQASLAQGITLGLRGNIPSAVNDNFKRTATSHILAISGFNLSILTGILAGVGVRLFGRRRYVYVWLTLTFIWLYAIITGLAAPVVRAAIMASLFLITEVLGRQRSAITALAAAAAIMVAISPQILWTVSFQMSFMAMVGLIFIAPLFQNLGNRAISRLKASDGARSFARLTSDAFAVSLGAVIAVAPMIAYYFGGISPVGPPATVLASPALAPIILLGALTGGLGFISLTAAQVAGWLVWLPLSYLILVVNGFAALPGAYLAVPDFHPAIVGGYYLALCLGLYLYYRGRGGFWAAQSLALARTEDA